MRSHGKTTLVESAIVLALLGILAGAVGGFAIGAVTSKTASSSASH
jgi:type II secretory pathway pseudopilin PulG